jgi:hypothetical protein
VAGQCGAQGGMRGAAGVGKEGEGAAGGEEGDGRGDPGARGGMQEPRERRGRGYDVTR